MALPTLCDDHLPRYRTSCQPRVERLARPTESAVRCLGMLDGRRVSTEFSCCTYFCWQRCFSEIPEDSEHPLEVQRSL